MYYKIYMFEVSTFSGLILVLVVVTWNFYELEGYLQGLCLKDFREWRAGGVGNAY